MIPTITDVAQQAGVSIATVSRVLNGTTPVDPATAERVRLAIASLHYTPRPAARTLASRKTDTIGLLLPEISGAFYPPMLRGIEAGVREAGYDLLIHSTQDSHRRRSLGPHNTDGLLIFPESVDEAELLRLHASNFPVVLLHQTPKGEITYPMVSVENKTGAEMLIDHLVEVHGKRRIVFLQGPPSHEDSLWRERGYRLSLQNHGIHLDPGLIGYGGFEDKAAAKTIQHMLSTGLAFDAVFAGDDDAAVGVLSSLLAAGRNVPEEIAVVGFDDVAFSRYLNPPLTTVRAPIEQVGREAVRLLVKRIQKQTCESEVLLPTELVVRESCGCCA
jgi:DNA-binding LacI/PurR family transcriptional regulator